MISYVTPIVFIRSNANAILRCWSLCSSSCHSQVTSGQGCVTFEKGCSRQAMFVGLPSKYTNPRMVGRPGDKNQSLLGSRNENDPQDAHFGIGVESPTTSPGRPFWDWFFLVPNSRQDAHLGIGVDSIIPKAFSRLY